MENNNSKTKHKPIRCPHCGRRLIDEDTASYTKIIENSSGIYYADYYIKCIKCTAEVGIMKIK